MPGLKLTSSLAAMAAVPLLIAACGGGGGEGSPTANTSPEPSPLATSVSPASSPETPVPLQELERAIHDCLSRPVRRFQPDRSGDL